MSFSERLFQVVAEVARGGASSSTTSAAAAPLSSNEPAAADASEEPPLVSKIKELCSLGKEALRVPNGTLLWCKSVADVVAQPTKRSVLCIEQFRYVVETLLPQSSMNAQTALEWTRILALMTSLRKENGDLVEPELKDSIIETKEMLGTSAMASALLDVAPTIRFDPEAVKYWCWTVVNLCYHEANKPMFLTQRLFAEVLAMYATALASAKSLDYWLSVIAELSDCESLHGALCTPEMVHMIMGGAQIVTQGTDAVTSWCWAIERFAGLTNGPHLLLGEEGFYQTFLQMEERAKCDESGVACWCCSLGNMASDTEIRLRLGTEETFQKLVDIFPAALENPSGVENWCFAILRLSVVTPNKKLFCRDPIVSNLIACVNVAKKNQKAAQYWCSSLLNLAAEDPGNIAYLSTQKTLEGMEAIGAVASESTAVGMRWCWALCNLTSAPEGAQMFCSEKIIRIFVALASSAAKDDAYSAKWKTPIEHFVRVPNPKKEILVMLCDDQSSNSLLSRSALLCINAWAEERFGCFGTEAATKSKSVALSKVKVDGSAMRFVDSSLRKDRDIALAAVEFNGFALQHLADSLKSDKEIVLAAVSEAGYALEFADENLRDDAEVVAAAVKQKGLALRFASDRLKNSEEIALAAVRQNPHALELVSSTLKESADFAKLVAPLDPLVLQLLPKEVQLVPEVAQVIQQMAAFPSGEDDDYDYY